MGLKSILDGFTLGRPNKEPPTPYSFAPTVFGTGVGQGTKGLAFQRSHTPPTDSYRGRQGIQVLRNLCPFEGGAVIAKPGTLIVDVVALASGVNATPGFTPLFDPKAQSGGGQ